MILLIDNFDSFVFNLARSFRELGEEVEVRRNNAIYVEEVTSERFSSVVLSPGPGTPEKAGACLPLLRWPELALPVLGICLGHQAIGEAFGGRLIRSRPVHGRASAIEHEGRGVFTELPMPFLAARYHSLAIAEPVSEKLRVTARAEGVVMGLEHVERPIHGVQFHPESILTDYGHQLLANFLQITKSRRDGAIEASSWPE